MELKKNLAILKIDLKTIKKKMKLSPTTKITSLLFMSGVLNIFFVSFFIYWMMQETYPTPYFELKPANSDEKQLPLAIDHSNGELISYFKTLTREQLVHKLSNSEFVENGYRIRDLSLAALVAFHHFDLSRALDNEQPTQTRLISYGLKKNKKPTKLLVYPGLTEKQYESLIWFARRERWPLTSKGLFLNLKNMKNRESHSLKDAFYLTQQFLSVEMLFSRSDVPVEKGELLTVLLDGNFEQLSLFSDQQRLTQDLTDARRHHFLLDYIKRGSKAAAYLFLKTDGPKIVRKLDDTSIYGMLCLLTEKTEEAGKFALAILTSPRSDAVLEMAAKRLYEYAGDPIPKTIDRKIALSKFLPEILTTQLAKEKKIVVEASEISKEIALKENVSLNRCEKKIMEYIIQEGDSLWKISRRFECDIDLLKRENHLFSDVLKPGSTLKIP